MSMDFGFFCKSAGFALLKWPSRFAKGRVQQHVIVVSGSITVGPKSDPTGNLCKPHLRTQLRPHTQVLYGN